MPTIIAEVRSASHSGVIFAINLFLGWTVLGWIAALIWAVVEKPADLAPMVNLDNYEYIADRKKREREAGS